jgi:hypothetical protein
MKPTVTAKPAKRIGRVTGTATLPVAPGTSIATSETVLEYYNNYAEYSKTLRAWLVAYGVGGPILFLTNTTISEKLAASPEKAKIVCLFLLGVSLQVALAFVNKWCAWHLYAGEYDQSYRRLLRYRFWAAINKLSILDLALDAASIGAFVWATWLVLMVFI